MLMFARAHFLWLLLLVPAILLGYALLRRGRRRRVRRFGEEAASEADEPYLVYCANCREVFKIRGKECRHILEEYFGPEADMEKVMKEVKIYAGLKTLIVERDTHRPMPEFRAMLEGTIY